MEAKKLYQQLEKDFITSQMSDEWAQDMDSISDFITSNFKERSMGVVCDFTSKIEKIYTAVFPSNEVMQKILNTNVQNALLFVHHPAIWDIRQAPEVFQQMDRTLLKQFKDRKISIYNLHVPLDNFGEYSTSTCLANSLNIKIIKPFAPYFGALAGIFGETNASTVQDLQTIFEKAVGHKVSLYNYGSNEIRNRTVAVVAGGGLNETKEEIAQNKINVLITGITAKNNHSAQDHKFAAANGINLLGGTHYSTEKFACQAMINYFSKLNLPAEFIEDVPIMEDL